MQISSRNYPGPYNYPGLAPALTEYDSRFYVGPLGNLRALPDTNDSVDTSLSIIGGTHTSLTGAFTRDVFGYKRAWTWDYKLLTDRQAMHVEAIQRNLVAGPLYLLDPRRPNRLPEQIATGGSLMRTPKGFIPSNTTLCNWRELTYPVADPATLPMSYLLRGCLQWQMLSPGTGGLELVGPSSDGRLDIPVLPAESLSVSLWATGPPSVALSGAATVYDRSGNAKAVSTLPATSLSMTTWQRIGVSFLCPADAASLRLTLSVPAGTPVGSVYVTALQVAPFNPVYVPGMQEFCGEDDLGGDWSLGGGAPQVVPDVASSSYMYPGLQKNGLVLIERSYTGTGPTTLITGNPTVATSGSGVAGTTSTPVFASRWVAGNLDGMQGDSSSWQSATPTVETGLAGWTSGRALHVNLPANGSSTPGGSATAPSGTYQRCENIVDLQAQRAVGGIDSDGDFGPGFTGYFGLSIKLDSDFPTNPRESGGGVAWQVMSQWKNDGTGSPPCDLKIGGGRLFLDGNSGGWSIDICAVGSGQRYDVVLGMTFTESASTSLISVWVNGTQYVTNAHPTGAGLLYAGVRSYWKVGIYRETGLPVQAKASAWYGAVCFDPQKANVDAYLTAT